MIKTKYENPREMQVIERGLMEKTKWNFRRLIRYLLWLGKIQRWEVLADLIKKNNFRNFTEVGVAVGKTSRYILRNCDLDWMICIDDYQKDSLFTEEELKKFSSRVDDLRNNPTVKFFSMRSKEVSKIIPDNSLDIVFIDADHEYNAVKEDIKWWYPKVREGGILAGHDFSVEHYGVIRAVTEIFYPINLREDTVWYVKKLTNIDKQQTAL